jgi:Fe-S-cluster-containing hydrogenase component 2
MPASVETTEEVDPLREQGGFAERIGPELMEFLTSRRFFNGTATMVINLDRCTRCDDCVRACASTHDNNPRFLRHGPISSGIQVAQACMHCVDPVCMIGCPTGAIHRAASGGNVVINQSTCIGCTSCANNCPYEAIRMVEARNERGGVVIDAEMRPIVKATKCDLCLDQYGGPACERACPHDALTRMDLTHLDRLAQWLER